MEVGWNRKQKRNKTKRRNEVKKIDQIKEENGKRNNKRKGRERE